MKVRTLIIVSVVTAFLLAPVSARAAERESHGDITIEWNGELDRAHGVRSGSGTPADPYVISGWSVSNLTIRDTDRAIRITDNTIAGRLTLDWIGPEIEVRGNDIGDLRVNQNVARWGAPSAGMIAGNTIGVVGQLRHYDGHFMGNTIGAPQLGPTGPRFPETRALNLDGFNGAHVTNNTIYGYVDARLHGHHHASEFGGGSHHHTAAPHTGEHLDHTRRFHQVFIHHNQIFTSHTYALAYLDTNHAGNDRTANSETNPYLNAPHVHFTRAHLVHNHVEGAGVLVDVFNAKDERHKRVARGLLRIAGNEVMLPWDARRPFQELNGIEVRDARALRLKVIGNTVMGEAPALEPLRPVQVRGTGLVLQRIDAARVVIRDLTVRDRRVGIRASRMTSSVRWTVAGLKTSGVQERIAYDGSASNDPT